GVVGDPLEVDPQPAVLLSSVEHRESSRPPLPVPLTVFSEFHLNGLDGAGQCSADHHLERRPIRGPLHMPLVGQTEVEVLVLHPSLKRLECRITQLVPVVAPHSAVQKAHAGSSPMSQSFFQSKVRLTSPNIGSPSPPASTPRT